jgi:hypothetical protein
MADFDGSNVKLSLGVMRLWRQEDQKSFGIAANNEHILLPILTINASDI